MSPDIKDLIIVGAGPSALTAAVYTTRENIDTTIFERAVVGGLAAITDRIDNYPGFPDGIEGFSLAAMLEKQAKRFGAKIEYGDVTAVRDEDGTKVITLGDKEYRAKALLISTGSSYSKIGVPGEKEYYGHGVSYCATCDGAFYKDKKIAVVGGANSAVQEALFLTRFASHIDLLVRSTVKADKNLQDQLQECVDQGKITVHLSTATNEIVGEGGRVTGVKVTENGESEQYDLEGVFVFVGLQPNTSCLLDSGIELDDQGFIKTDLSLTTNIKGIFASGDVRSGATRQIASAVGEGATAAHSIRDYLNQLG